MSLSELFLLTDWPNQASSLSTSFGLSESKAVSGSKHFGFSVFFLGTNGLDSSKSFCRSNEGVFHAKTLVSSGLSGGNGKESEQNGGSSESTEEVSGDLFGDDEMRRMIVEKKGAWIGYYVACVISFIVVAIEFGRLMYLEGIQAINEGCDLGVNGRLSAEEADGGSLPNGGKVF
jgi:hypothetical protein